MTAPGLLGVRPHESRRWLRDPALSLTIVGLWLLLALFVLYPLAHDSARMIFR